MGNDTTEAIASTFSQSQDTQVTPTVACLRCRGQKLRCNRELPSCERCRKQNAVCFYPAPPNRREIAQRTSRSKGAQSLREPLREQQAPPLDPPSFKSTTTAKRQRVAARGTLAEEPPAPTPNKAGSAELPTTEVGLLLLEVYFKRIYNATLLFHKPIAFQLYMQNGIPDFLLRAIFAHAAVFMKEVDGCPHGIKHVNIFPMQHVYANSWAWARAASVEALAHADEPSLVRLQALQVLQYYYFSQGESTRAKIHASLACKMSQVLGYDQLYEETTLQANPGMQFDREMRRRSFWASWCSQILGGSGLDPSQVFQRVANLPLPARFGKGGSIQRVDLKQGERLDRNWRSMTEVPTDSRLAPCLMAELVKILGIWVKVQAFISNNNTARSELHIRNDIDTLNELFVIVKGSMKISIADLRSRAEVFEESPELVASVCTMLHLSRLLMHASMIPILSGRPTQSSVPQRASSDHIKMVLHDADEYVKILQQIVKHNLDITRLWPISGYGSFMVGNVFLVRVEKVLNSTPISVWAADNSVVVPGKESEEMKMVQSVLDVLASYWQPLRKLSNKLKSAREKGWSGSVSMTPSAYPGYGLSEHDDGINNPGSPNRNGPVRRGLSPEVSPTTRQEQDPEMSHGNHRAVPGSRTFPKANIALSQSTPQATGAFDELLTCPEPPVNGYRDGIFDEGWWNDIHTMHEWDY